MKKEDPVQLPGATSRRDFLRAAGAMSCLTGIAARASSETGRPVNIADLLPLAGLPA